MAALSLSGLYIYPIKSAAGIAVREAKLTRRGLEYDRRWMVVDGQGKFLTQRRFPRMTLISVTMEDSLRVCGSGMPDLEVPLGSEGETVEVEVWGDRTQAIPVSDESKAWFTQFLGIDAQLVYMPDDAQRPTEHGAFGADNLVSFADAYPYLLLTEASLDGLNKRLQEKGTTPVTMKRFRPNLVVAGSIKPHAEDDWRQVRIGEATFDLPKKCARCSIPNVNPQTGERAKEPSQTLASYRAWDRGIWFGQNGVQVSPGSRSEIMLRVGDAVEVLKEMPPASQS